MKCFLFSLFNWKFEGADIVMEWVALITVQCALFSCSLIEMLESSDRKEKVFAPGSSRHQRKNRK